MEKYFSKKNSTIAYNAICEYQENHKRGKEALEALLHKIDCIGAVDLDDHEIMLLARSLNYHARINEFSQDVYCEWDLEEFDGMSNEEYFYLLHVMLDSIKK